MATDVEHEHAPPGPTESTESTVQIAVDRTPLAGDLTPGWHKLTLLLWILVLLALAAVWSASVQLGLATWWLGPRGDRNPLVVQLLPFMPPLIMQIITLLGVRWTGRYGIVAGLSIVVVGIFDFGRVSGLAWVEVAIGLAAAVASAASLAGTYRRSSE